MGDNTIENSQGIQTQQEPIEQLPVETKEDDKELSDEHSLFLDYFLKSFNGTRAYMAVYPDSTEQAAAVSATRLLRNPKIIEEKKRRIQEIRDRIPDEIIPYLENQIKFNISDFLDKNGKPDLQKIKESQFPGLVSSVSYHEDSFKQDDKSEITKTKMNFKLIDQQKSIEILSKILKLYEEKTELNINQPIINISFDANPNDASQSPNQQETPSES